MLSGKLLAGWSSFQVKARESLVKWKKKMTSESRATGQGWGWEKGVGKEEALA